MIVSEHPKNEGISPDEPPPLPARVAHKPSPTVHQTFSAQAGQNPWQGKSAIPDGTSAAAVPGSRSQFRPLSDMEIRTMAENQLRQQATVQSKFGCGSVGVAIILACVFLLIPIVGPFCSAGIMIGAVIRFFMSTCSRPAINPQQLAGLCYQWRGLMTGTCPVCRGNINVFGMNSSPVYRVACPLCQTPLQCDGTNHIVLPG
jgi:hypothetical protein